MSVQLFHLPIEAEFLPLPHLPISLPRILHYDHSYVCDSDLQHHPFEYSKLNPKGCLH